MATKIQVGADASQATSALGEVTSELKKTAAAADQTGSEMDAAFDHANRIQDFKEKIDDLTAALAKAESQAKETNAEVGNPGAGKAGGDGKAKWTEFLTAAGGAVTVAKAVYEGMKQAREEIGRLADAGSETFGKLNAALTEFDDAWEDLKLNLADSKEGEGLGGLLTTLAEGAAAAASNFDILDESIGAYYTGVAAAALETIGWTSAANKAREAQAEFNAELERGAEAQLKEKIARQNDLVGGLRDDLEKRRQQDKELAAIAEIKSTDEITAKIEEQFAALKRLADVGSLTSKDRQEAAKRIDALERRRLDLVKEIAAAEKQAAEAAKAATKAQGELFTNAAEGIADFASGMLDDLTKTGSAVVATVSDVIDKTIAERKARVDALARTQEAKGAAEQIKKDASDPNAIRDRLAQNAADEAQRKALEGDGVVSRDEQRGIDQAKRDAYRKATMQARGGFQAFSQEDIAGAVNQNAEAQIRAMQAAGKTTQDVSDALSQVLGLAQQFDSQQAQQQQQIAAMQQQLATLFNNGRRRAQTKGNSLW